MGVYWVFYGIILVSQSVPVTDYIVHVNPIKHGDASAHLPSDQWITPQSACK